jgi:hypothetical protein
MRHCRVSRDQFDAKTGGVTVNVVNRILLEVCNDADDSSVFLTEPPHADSRQQRQVGGISPAVGLIDRSFKVQHQPVRVVEMKDAIFGGAARSDFNFCSISALSAAD